MSLIRASLLSDLPENSATEFFHGDHNIAICHVGGEIYALDGICPHRGGPLAQGALHGNMLVCPWHAWEFDCTTGIHDHNPEIRQDQFAVTVSGDDILVEIPDA